MHYFDWDTFYTKPWNLIFVIPFTYIFMQGANESGCQDVPFLAAEFHRRLNPIIHHQSQQLVHRIRPMIGKLAAKR